MSLVKFTQSLRRAASLAGATMILACGGGGGGGGGVNCATTPTDPSCPQPKPVASAAVPQISGNFTDGDSIPVQFSASTTKQMLDSLGLDGYIVRGPAQTLQGTKNVELQAGPNTFTATPYQTGADITAASTTVNAAAINGGLRFDKASYNVGDQIRLTATGNGDSLKVTIPGMTLNPVKGDSTDYVFTATTPGTLPATLTIVNGRKNATKAPVSATIVQPVQKATLEFKVLNRETFEPYTSGGAIILLKRGTLDTLKENIAGSKATFINLDVGTYDVFNAQTNGKTFPTLRLEDSQGNFKGMVYTGNDNSQFNKDRPSTPITVTAGINEYTALLRPKTGLINDLTYQAVFQSWFNDGQGGYAFIGDSVKIQLPTQALNYWGGCKKLSETELQIAELDFLRLSAETKSINDWLISKGRRERIPYATVTRVAAPTVTDSQSATPELPVGSAAYGILTVCIKPTAPSNSLARNNLTGEYLSAVANLPAVTPEAIYGEGMNLLSTEGESTGFEDLHLLDRSTKRHFLTDTQFGFSSMATLYTDLREVVKQSKLDRLAWPKFQFGQH